MTPVRFKGHTCVFAEHQPEYLPLPVHVAPDGCVTSCWQLTWCERVRVLCTGLVWLSGLTFNQPMQLLLPSTERPEETGQEHD